MRAVIYNRVSLDRDGDELAVTRQNKLAIELANQRGWTIAATYTDNSLSATKRTVRRPQYEAMLAAYEAGRFDALITYDLDRLTRQPRQLEDWIDRAEGQGLAIVTLNGEADLTTDGGRMFARIKVAVARAEVERKAQRQKDAIAQRVENGVVPAGVRLTGYHQNGDVHPKEAAVVRDLFDRFLRGESLRGLAQMLNDEGVETRSAIRHRAAVAKAKKDGAVPPPEPRTLWMASTVLGMLKNPRYAGRAAFRGKATGHRGQWEAIVDEAVFDAVQAKLSDPRRKKNLLGTERKHLGGGLYLCGEPGCGRRVQTVNTQYGCHTKGHPYRVRHQIDEYVLALTRARLERAAREGLSRPRDDSKMVAVDAEARRLRQRLEQVEQDYDTDLIDAPRYKAKRDKILAELRALEAQRARTLGGVALEGIMGADDPVVAFDGASLGVQRAVIDAFMTVTLLRSNRSKKFDPATVQIDWHGDSQ